MAAEHILILDFGSQTTALIGRRIRELGIYGEIIPGDSALSEEILDGVKGIILSGSPESVNGSGLKADRRIYECNLPLLGICYGLHLMTVDLGGAVQPLPAREAGGVEVRIGDRPPADMKSPNWDAMAFFSGFLWRDDLNLWNLLMNKKSLSRLNVWMSHSDSITKLANNFVEIGTSAKGYPAIVYHREKPWFGVQFHPEVSHCERGAELLGAFVRDVCHCAANWSVKSYLEETLGTLKQKAADRTVLLLISGGIDSTVAAALLLKALPAKNIHLMYMDTGLMRKNETAAVKQTLESLGAQNIHIIQCQDEFLSALSGVETPEAKRKIIGDMFIKIQEREVERLALPKDYILAQGTLYTDLIESGKGVGSKAHTIKTHHNVGTPLVEAKRAAGALLEPLDKLYKDEVRLLGALLSLDDEVLHRHPFPGPGLAVRILGEVNSEKCEALREADSIFIEELKKRRNPLTQKTLYNEIWQAFAVLLPVRSVGVSGDERKYGWVLSLRAVTSADGMTAGVYNFKMNDIIEISTRITNEVPAIGRVVYDVSSKPPATIEWE